MSEREASDTFSNLLRAALREAESLNQVAKDTGLVRQSLARFMRGEQSIRLDLADRLAEYFGIESRARKRRAR